VAVGYGLAVHYFNTAGPCDPERHYMVPVETRLPEACSLVEQGGYFVVHAPRQTGKTTTLDALARHFTATGRFAAVLFSCERAEAAGDDYAAAELALLAALRGDAEIQRLPAEWLPPDPWPETSPGSRIHQGLRAWAERCPVPLVLVFDEIDALRGQSLISVLRQLRDGYRSRPESFPASVILCGLRDVRDYRAASGGDPTRLGTASPFNVKVGSLRLGDFTREEVTALYAQHTAETGQEFTAAALGRAFDYTRGQPWLANALAAEIVDKMRVTPPDPITAEHVDTAKERLILARATHLDSLAARLQEPRVRRVIQPLLAGTLPDPDPSFDDDVAYVRDLGLIATDKPVRVANPIYSEVIARVLGDTFEEMITAEPQSFLLADGRVDFAMLLEEFAAWWRRHGEFLSARGNYPEAAPQLIMMGFLHRIVNGGGFVDREYGVGRGRIDLLVRKPYTASGGERGMQHEAVEIKAWHPGEPDPLAEGLTQLDRYLDRFDLPTGTLAVFDARPIAPPIHERTTITSARTPAGRVITLFRG
jgi:hypothetical protein